MYYIKQKGREQKNNKVLNCKLTQRVNCGIIYKCYTNIILESDGALFLRFKLTKWESDTGR